MKKLLLIPTLATSVVAPIIATTSCSNDGWISWDFAENEEYDYKMSIPASTVSAEKAFSQYLDMIEQNPNDFVHEYMLSISKNIKDTMKDPDESLSIRTWKDEIKVISFDKKQKRISFSAKLNQDCTFRIVDSMNSNRTITSKKTYDIVCENIPLSYFAVSGGEDTAFYVIGTGADGIDKRELQDLLSKDKKWSVTGSFYELQERTREGGQPFTAEWQDTDFTYNYKITDPSVWDGVVGCCCQVLSVFDHPSYYMSNIPVSE